MRSLRPEALCLAATLLGGCAAVSPEAPVAGPPDCVALFEAVDAAIDRAGVRDGGEHRPSGFPYLRSNRFLASFAGELEPAQLPDWLGHLRQLDLAARKAELANLNNPDWTRGQLAALAECGARWMAQDALSPRRMQQLQGAVAVPDDYSALARTLGVYPLSALFLRMGVSAYQQGILSEYRADWQAPQASWQLWEVAASEARSMTAQPWHRDSLGIPQLAAGTRAALLARHAPAFLIDRRGDFDEPGRPLPGAGFEARPEIYQHFSWTRFHGQVLPQLVYVLWFSRRPPEGPLDPYAGALDSVIWRVTLDADGQPLLYDSVHSCGCYHSLYPARRLALAGRSEAWQERPVMPQGQVPWSDVAVVLDSGRHYVRRVIPRIQAEALVEETAALTPVSYDLLRMLPVGGSRRASLFRSDGLVAGSERLERYWLWPSGVPDPGAMRQWGRQATAFIGRAHFDDPQALERWFEAPAP